MKIWKSSKLAKKIADGTIEVICEVGRQYREIRWASTGKVETVQVEA